MKKLRVVVLMHPSLVPPESLEGYTEQESYEWKTEFDVVSTLRELGHEVKPLGVADELGPIRTVIEEWKPDIVFNLLEEFLGRQDFDHHVVSFLELMQVPYTGCHPRGLMLARDKALSKKLLVYHHLAVPKFAVFPRGRKVRRPKGLAFPLIVKSQIHEASLGISQASIVDSDEKLAERVAFIHQRHTSDAIAEQYVDGREFYVGIIGNARLEVLPVWELVFENMPPGASSIATAHVKHNPDYQRRRGIYQQHADDLEPPLLEHIKRTSRRIAHILDLDGYNRIDYRLGGDGKLYFLEANPNPDIAKSEEFASAAEEAGKSFPELIQRLLVLGLQRFAGRG
ncbi:MAG TPA: D-alanine--D-alanine ligase [Thermoanaerobaculia bacterium]|jgi:D-alanine-D-alanine ligase|nr:D-alanine--D-alanine ligase [Thermoanaerobaculia bacterium]